MSTENTIKRLKEICENHDEVMRKIRNRKLTADTRTMIKRVREEMIREIKQLVKRL